MQISVEHDDRKRNQKHGVRRLELRNLSRIAAAVPTCECLQIKLITTITTINYQWRCKMGTSTRSRFRKRSQPASLLPPVIYSFLNFNADIQCSARGTALAAHKYKNKQNQII